MSVAVWNVLLTVAAVVCLAVSSGLAWMWRQVVLGLISAGLALWVVVALIAYVRAV